MQALRALARNKIVSLAAGLLFPSECPVCAGRSDAFAPAPLCEKCWNTISAYSGGGCRICAEPLPSGVPNTCARCIAKPPRYDRAFHYGLYEGALKEAIHAVKFGGTRRLAGALAEKLATVPLPEADLLAAVPLTKKGLLARGFNQSLLLAKGVSQASGIPLRLEALLKIRETGPQAMLDREERLKNLRGAFTADPCVKGRAVILVDDVMTTGATMNECARALRKAGALKVYALSLARAGL